MKEFRFFLALFFLLIFGTTYSPSVHALSIDELKIQIEQKRLEKAKLDAEKVKLEQQIQETGKQTQTLQSAVKVLDTTQKKLTTDIKVTQNTIGSTELVIEKTGLEITSTSQKINVNEEAIAETVRNVAQTDDQSFIESMLQYKNINDLWNDIETLRQFQTFIKGTVDELKGLKTNLEEQKKEKEEKKQELVHLKSNLVVQNSIVEKNKTAKTELLNETKNKEAVYKQLLAKNIELGKKFEEELFLFESELNSQIDESKLPSTRPGILSWPLSKITITQRFGKTSDSGRLYVSGTHNGVDFGIPVGTPVLSAAEGVISGMGNTDEQSGCYSYGRWILIRHGNGLSTLYAHLSGSTVKNGDQVARGQLIGYSGGQPGMSGSGYSTGPHLHMGLFATEGVTVQKYTSSKFCKNVSIPISGINAYLDPLAYLPGLN